MGYYFSESYSLFLMSLNKYYFIIILLIAAQMYYYQIFKLNITNAYDCLKVFKSNNVLGLIVFVSLLVGRI